jgi:hypothetical protein
MRLNPAASILAPIAFAVLASCGGETGGYAPPPPAFEASPAAVAAVKQPKFKPIVDALLAQHEASAALAERVDGKLPMDYGERSARANSAAAAVSAAIARAQLTPEELRIWNEIGAMTAEQLRTARGG